MDGRRGQEYRSGLCPGRCAYRDRDGNGRAKRKRGNMTNEELKKMKYRVCCPLCDNDKCVKGTDKCEAEKWEKARIRNDKT